MKRADSLFITWQSAVGVVLGLVAATGLPQAWSNAIAPDSTGNERITRACVEELTARAGEDSGFPPMDEEKILATCSHPEVFEMGIPCEAGTGRAEIYVFRETRLVHFERYAVYSVGSLGEPVALSDESVAAEWIAAQLRACNDTVALIDFYRMFFRIMYWPIRDTEPPGAICAHSAESVETCQEPVILERGDGGRRAFLRVRADWDRGDEALDREIWVRWQIDAFATGEFSARVLTDRTVPSSPTDPGPGCHQSPSSWSRKSDSSVAASIQRSTRSRILA
jgi:hypothetical protein